MARSSRALLLLGLSACDVRPPTAAETPSLSGAVLVVDLIDGTSLEDARAATGLDLAWATSVSSDEALAVVAVADPAAAAAALGGNPLVEAAEPSLVFEALGYPDDPLYPRQWNLAKVGASAGWRAGSGAGVLVAVIDTGVSPVPDLGGTRVLPGLSLLPGGGDGRDEHGHGTHVAGTIGQTTNNGLGVAGLAPAATILPLKVLDATGRGSSQGVAAAIDEAVDEGAAVINLSLGGPHSKVLDLAVKKATRAGVLVVAAAGNTGAEGVGCPAHAPGALAVSATGPQDRLAFYSTFGPEVALSAPGGDKNLEGGGILQDTLDPSAEDGHGFLELQGTSMATPHVTGAAAVLLGLGAPSGQAAAALLEETAVDLGDPGRDARYGYGRIDVAAAAQGAVSRYGLSRFLLGGLLSLGLVWIGRLRRGPLLVAIGGLSAAGLFFLPLLPLPPSLAFLGTAPLLWPAAVLPPFWARSPLLLSAALPFALTFALGLTRSLGPVVAAISAGFGAWLLSAAWAGGPLPSLLPPSLGQVWLGANGLFALFCALAAVGAQRRLHAG